MKIDHFEHFKVIIFYLVSLAPTEQKWSGPLKCFYKNYEYPNKKLNLSKRSRATLQFILSLKQDH